MSGFKAGQSLPGQTVLEIRTNHIDVLPARFLIGEADFGDGHFALRFDVGRHDRTRHIGLRVDQIESRTHGRRRRRIVIFAGYDRQRQQSDHTQKILLHNKLFISLT